MLDSIIKLSLKYRYLLVATTALVVAWGGYVASKMPIDVFPDLNRPTVTIMAEAGGMAPQDIENQVTTPIENLMSGLPGVTRVRSTSASGFGMIWVEFDWDQDILKCRQLVSEKLSLSKESIPDGVIPHMGPISSLMGEIMIVGLSSPKDTIGPMELRTLADWKLRPQLQSISGVSQVITIGGGVKQLQILANADEMARYDIHFSDLAEKASVIGQNTTGGFSTSYHEELLIRNIATPITLDGVKDLVVKIVDGVPVTFGMVADVKFGPQVRRGDAGIDAQSGVIMAIQKQPGANTVALTKKLESSLIDLTKTLPKDVEIKTVFKQATFIRTAISNVEEALRDGSIFVAIILILFLMNMRTTAITLTAIPISLIMTALIFEYFGLTINAMTLGGLAVAIGELVDDAIVDVENVFRRLRENRQLAKPRPYLQVIFEASSEIRNSIVIATAIVILVFVPLFFMSGLEGRFFVPLGIAYVVSIFASLIVSLTVTPALCAILLPRSKATESGKDGWLVARLKRAQNFLLVRAIKKPKTVISSVFAALVLAIIVLLSFGKEFLPPFNEGTVTAFVVTPPGTSLPESIKMGQLAENLLLDVPEVTITGRRTGRAEQDEHAEGVYNNEIDLNLKDSDRSRDEILGDMRSRLKQIPGIAVGLGQPLAHRMDHMMSGVQAQIAIKIFGPDLGTLRHLAEDVKGTLAGVEGLADLQIERVTQIPQMQVIPQAQEAKRYGLNPGDITSYLGLALEGENVSQIFEDRTRIAVHLRFKDENKRTPENLRNLLIDTPVGKKVPLGSVATVQQVRAPNMINHENGMRRLIVMANTEGKDLGSVVEDAQKKLADFPFPEGYFIQFDGQFKSQIEATRTIGLLSLMSLIGIFGILFAYFRSSFLAMQVMINIPLALIGSVAAVALTGSVLSVGSLVGFVTLCGIASRNGILLISHYLYLMRSGHSFSKEMVLKGSSERLVPMLMTAFTAILALMPIALAAGEPGKEILQPVAVVILGGLMTSTVLDIFVTPTIFFNYGRKTAEGRCIDDEEDDEPHLGRSA